MTVSRPRIVLIALAVLALAGLALVWLVDLNAYKPRIEAAASRASGMEVRIGGDIGLGFYPGLRVRIDDLRVRNRGTDLLTVKRVQAGVGWRALLAGRVELDSLTLRAPVLHIERSADGRYNYERSEPSGKPASPFRLGRLTASDATVHYVDRQGGRSIDANACRVDLRDWVFAGGPAAEARRRLALRGELACATLRTAGQSVSDLSASFVADAGTYTLAPLRLRLFDAQGSGRVRADFTADLPTVQMDMALPRFSLADALALKPGQQAPEGRADFAASLTMQGRDASALKHSLQGKVSLRGSGIVLHGVDLDETFDRFEDSQRFNLVDVGAVLLAGPIGLAVTKGHDFASILGGLKGRSDIRTLVSDWSVSRGVLQAEDVAIATQRHRVAMQGRLNLVDQRFDGVTVALLDSDGCATVRQAIRGSFARPEIERPSTLRTLAGPVVRLFKQVVPGTCEPYYRGSVARPQ